MRGASVDRTSNMEKSLRMKVPRGTGHPDHGARVPCGATGLAHQDAPNPEPVPRQPSGPCATIPPTYSGRKGESLRFKTVRVGAGATPGPKTHRFWMPIAMRQPFQSSWDHLFGPPGPKRALCYTKTTNAGANEAAGATEAPSPFADSARAILLLKSLPPPVLMVLRRAGDLDPPSRATRARPTHRTTPETCRPCRAGRTAIRLHSPPDCCRDGLELPGMPLGHAPTDADALSRF